MAGGEERRLGRKLGGTKEHACPGTDGQSPLSAGPWARSRAGPEAAPRAGAAMLPVPPARGAPPQGTLASCSGEGATGALGAVQGRRGHTEGAAPRRVCGQDCGLEAGRPARQLLQ